MGPTAFQPLYFPCRWLATTGIAADRIAASTPDGDVAQASSAIEPLFGIVQERVVANDQAKVIQGGIAKLELGGQVACGDLITSDELGRGVAAVPAPGELVRVVAIALAAGAIGSKIPVVVQFGGMRG